MRMRRILRSISTFLSQLSVALLKTAVTSVVLGAVLVSVMQYMGVPVPSAHELLNGISQLANVLS